VQNSKGGGLASNFASSNQFMGVRKTTDFLEKATWILATGLLVFSLLATITMPKSLEDKRSIIEGQFDPGSNLNDPSNQILTLPETSPDEESEE
jgi:preprotein translocase subunit SecG